MPRKFEHTHRPTYTPSQLSLYFRRINLPASELSSPIATSLDASTATPQEALRFLGVLLRRNLCAIPFENLSLHYSPHKTISIDPHALFAKIVCPGGAQQTLDVEDVKETSNRPHNTNSSSNGNVEPSPLLSHRGGYCMENSCLFATVLRSLNYDITTVGARVNEAAQPMAASPYWKGPKWDGWNHMIVHVSLPAQQDDGEEAKKEKWLVDVGFGSCAPMHPMLLVDGMQITNTGDMESRLVRRSVFPQGGSDDAAQKLWIYEYRFNKQADWTPTYCFGETEFLPEDFAMMNYYMSTHRASWFTFYVVCVRMILDEQSGEVVGDKTLFEKEFKRRIKGESDAGAEIKSEEDRIRVLEDEFGIQLSAAERAGIIGMKSELL